MRNLASLCQSLYKLARFAVSSVAAALLDCLRSVERPGDFCIGGKRQIFMPAIDVDGVGRIAFPRPAGASRATDRDRRGGTLRTGRGDAGRSPGPKDLADRFRKVRIGGRLWEETLAELVAHVALGLGVSEPVAADFYKLLVYDAGSFFVGHRDTEKVPGMFATMVLVLPSLHSGGELVIQHLGRETILDPRPEEPSEIGFAGFYADCVHEVRPVTTGYRLTLDL